MTELDKLNALKDQMNTFRPLSKSEVEAIDKEKKYDHVWSSNAIEGSSLTKYETAALLETGLTVHGKPLADHLAAIDLSQAYDYVQKLALGQLPLDQVAIRDVNRLVTYSNEATQRAFAGQYRQIEVHPNGVPDVHYAEPSLIPSKMADLLDWYQKADQQLHPIKVAALLHLKLVTIHPFRDGNGRTARLLMNFELIKHGFLLINIQPDPKSRKTYMEALRLAQTKHNEQPFIDLVSNYEEQELEDRLQLLKRIEKERKFAATQTRLSGNNLESLSDDNQTPTH